MEVAVHVLVVAGAEANDRKGEDEAGQHPGAEKVPAPDSVKQGVEPLLHHCQIDPADPWVFQSDSPVSYAARMYSIYPATAWENPVGCRRYHLVKLMVRMAIRSRVSLRDFLHKKQTRLPSFAPAASLDMERIRQAIVQCEACPRLREYCARIGETRRRAYLDQTYWARPVPGFGDTRARVLVLGLAPGAHGANRTGRPFTGDGSGDFMYPVLHELGFASGPKAISREDGLRLRDMWIGSVVRCAPPGDKPTPDEVRRCGAHLAAEMRALGRVRVVVCLGKIAWDGFLAQQLAAGVIARRSEYRFGHGMEYTLSNGVHLLGSYHPSLRNTNTGRLDRAMFARVFVRARELAGLGE